MALKQTVSQMRSHLNQIMQDLDKSDRGNKAASQRVRTGTIRLEKIAKMFRKESIKDEKVNSGKKKPAKAAVKKAAKSHAHKKAAKPVKHSKPAKVVKAAKHATHAKHAPKKQVMKAKSKAPMKSKKATAGSRAMTLHRRQTAKLPSRKTMR